MIKLKVIGRALYIRSFTIITMMINLLAAASVFSETDAKLPGNSVSPLPISHSNEVRPIDPSELLEDRRVTEFFSDFFTPPEQFRQSRIANRHFFDVLPPLIQCAPLTFPADLIDQRSNDLGTDGQDESYKMVSLLECNGKNYVSPVKMQRRGSCGWYSSIASLETLLGIKYSDLRPVTADHPANDFLPVNLSEGYLMYSKEGSGERYSAVLSGATKNAWQGITTHDAFYPDPELQVPWGEEWDQQMVDALKRRHKQTSEYCRNLASPQPPLDPDDQGKFIPIFNCLFDVAKSKHLVFVKEKDQVQVPASICYDTQTSESAGDCSTLSNYGAFGDKYQVDYKAVDQQIKLLLSNGRPVRASVHSNGYEERQRVDVSINAHYDFKLLAPKPLPHFETTGNGYIIGQKRYAFTTGHSVLIVGYLEGIDTNKDFWIVKNSHTQNQINNRLEDEFFLIGTASTSGEINETSSTKRILFLNGKGTKYEVQIDVEFVRLNPGTDTTKKVLATSNDNYILHDQDGDGVVDFFDNCPVIPNATQLDRDRDFVGDSCDHCRDKYDRFQDQSDPNLFLNDLDKDYVPRLCDTTPPIAGLSVLQLSAASLRARGSLSWSPGHFRGGWVFGMNNEVIGIGDLNKNGRDDFILRSSWGISVVEVSGTSFSVVTLKKHGTAAGAWILDKEDKYFGPGDFDHDGKEEFIVFNTVSGQLGIIGLEAQSDLNVPIVYRAGELMGGWRLGSDNVIAGVGDFDRDGAHEFIIRSPGWGMGIIQSAQSGKLEDLLMFPVGTHLGEWNYGTNDRVGGVGDFNGDGQDDIILQSDWGLGIVTRSAQQKLVSTTMVRSGTSLGNWSYGAEDKVVTVLNADGDDADEFVLKSTWGIGIIDRLDNGNLLYKVAEKFGRSLQDWYLSQDDKIVAVGNFDGAGPDEFIIQSQHGIGIITINNVNELTPISIHPYNSWMGDWFLRPENIVLGTGDFVFSGTDELLIKPFNP